MCRCSKQFPLDGMSERLLNEFCCFEVDVFVEVLFFGVSINFRSDKSWFWVDGGFCW